MADARFGGLVDAKRAVRTYVQESLSVAVTAVDGERVMNLEVGFSRFLQERGIGENVASELAAEQYELVRRKVERHIGVWTDHGLASPAGFHVEQERTLVTWRHERFEELTGQVRPRSELFDTQQSVARLLNRHFLLPCACYLHSLGCDPIYVTDGTRDEGIDLVGLVRTGPFRSSILYVQAKSQGRISGDELLKEFGKFKALPQTSRHLQYLDALGASRLKDGAGFLYLCLVNGEFDFAAEEQGRNLGALLRSRRQIADQLSRTYTSARLAEIEAAVVIPDGPDLQRNLAPALAP